MGTATSFGKNGSLLFDIQENNILFFVHGLNALCALKHLPDMGEINIENYIIYNWYYGINPKDIKRIFFNKSKPILTFSDLLGFLSEIEVNQKIQIDILDIQGKNSRLFCGEEGSEFNFWFDPKTYPDFLNNGFESLLMHCFNFDKEVSKGLIEVVKQNPGKYIVIDTGGKILQIYNTVDEYLESEYD